MVKKDQVIANQFRILGPIGAGGMGEVFKAQDINLGRMVAIKFLPVVYKKNEDLSQRFVNEGRILATVSHPCVVTIYASGVDEKEQIPYLAMEYIDGGILSDLKGEFLKDKVRFLGMMLDLLGGIYACHQKGIIHRDLKPDNILVSKDGKLKIIDFGLAKTMIHHTVARIVMGTPEYMAPEQISLNASVTPKSDIYSLGIIIWEFLTGRVPFEVRESVIDPILSMAMMHMNKEPPLEILLRHPFNARFKTLLGLMLSKRPEERPEIPAIVNSIKKELQRTGAQRDAIVVPTVGSFPEKQSDEGFWAEKLLSEIEVQKNQSYSGISVDRSVAIKNLQCLLLSSDKTLSKLVELSLKEYGFKYKLTDAIGNLGNLSSDSLTIAWFIDLDNILQGIEEIAYMARKVAPEAKLVFLSSYFTRELAEQCVQQKATSLLVKPILVPLLTQTINSLCQEPELLDGQDLIPATTEPAGNLSEKTDDHYLQKHVMCCPICSENFETMRFKSWLFPVHGTDTDFCPICPQGVCPEMHSIAVCPKCFYANTTGRFGRLSYDEEECESFIEKSKVDDRRKAALDLDFREKRNLLSGIKSYELAVMTLTELKTPRLDKLAGEFHLKASWLCRRMGQRLKEQEFQSKALECFMRLYQPYHLVNGKYPSKEKIQSKLRPDESPLKERIIIVIGFLAGEISRRLKLFDHARFYFQEVKRLPFARSYPVLLRGIDSSNELLETELKLLMHG